MIVSDEGQARVFLIYIIFGIICIMLSDLFRVVIKRFGATRVKINIFDTVYFFITFCLILYAGVKFNFGALRYYQLFGLVLGMAVQKLLLSEVCERVFDFLLSVFLKVFGFVLKIIRKAVMLVLRLIFTVTEYIEGKIMIICHKLAVRAKKVKIKKEKKKKTVKKRLKMI
ncbi:MAG: hypothetical protein IKU60_04420 [Clostridia bacterium]|nr:hypothetical protein [Clostridia bacterium]